MARKVVQKCCVELDALSLVPELDLEEIFAIEVNDVKSLDFLDDGRIIVAQYRKGKVKIIDFMAEENHIEKYFKTGFRTTGIAALGGSSNYRGCSWNRESTSKVEGANSYV